MSKHSKLRERLEEEIALELYDLPLNSLTRYELADVSRFLETRIMKHVRAYIERNYERKTRES